VRLENTNGKSSKFWEAEVRDTTMVIRYGRIGTDGRELTKSYPSQAAAQASLDSTTQDKLRHGYHAADSFEAASPGPTATPDPTASSIRPLVSTSDLARFAYSLDVVRQQVRKLLGAVDQWQNPAGGGVLATMSTLSARTRMDAAIQGKAFDEQVRDALASWAGKEAKSSPTPEQLTQARELLRAMSSWLESLDLPPLSFSLRDSRSSLASALKNALSDLPKSLRQDLFGLSQFTFRTLNPSDQRMVVERASDYGYQVTSVAAGKARALLGKEKTRELFDSLNARAEKDSAAYDRVKLKAPRIIEVERISNGAQDLAYRITGVVNWTNKDGNDVDIFSDWMVDVQGNPFFQDFK
jgi:predicted DNA-binding WGR domain protein